MSIESTDHNHPIIGIDFGTTKTMVAEFDRRKSYAKIRKLGRDSDAMPTSMYHVAGGEILFGDDADDEGLHDMMNHKRRFKMRLGNNNGEKFGPRTATPVELAAHFLYHVRTRLETEVCHRKVEKVVLTVPAMFGPAQRKDLETAALQAGFKQIELLAEPVAAGIAYCHDHTDLSKELRFLVVDWGGGTFDLAVVERNSSGEYRVVNDYIGGTCDIGGEDLDDEFWLHVSSRLSQQGHGTLDAQLPHEWGKYRRELTRAKEALSTKDEVSISLTLQIGSLQRLKYSRNEFEEVISSKIKYGADLVKNLVDRCRSEGCELDFILLAGGTSRIPMIAAALEVVNGINCRAWSEGREAIALGAAIKASDVCVTQPMDANAKGSIERTPNQILPADNPTRNINTQSTSHINHVDVLLTSVGTNTMTTIKALRDVVPSISLAEAEMLAKCAPVKIIRDATLPSAKEVKEYLENTGASVHLVHTTSYSMVSNSKKGNELVLTDSNYYSPDDTLATAHQHSELDVNSSIDLKLEKSLVGLEVLALAPDAHPELGEEFVSRTHFPVSYLLKVTNTCGRQLHSVRLSMVSEGGQRHSILIPELHPGDSNAIALSTSDMDGWCIQQGDTLSVDCFDAGQTTLNVTSDVCNSIDKGYALKEEIPCLVVLRKATFSSNCVLKIINITDSKLILSEMTGFSSPAGGLKSQITIEPGSECEIGWLELKNERNLQPGEDFLIRILGYRGIKGVVAEGNLKGNAAWAVLGGIGALAAAIAGS